MGPSRPPAIARSGVARAIFNRTSTSGALVGAANQIGLAFVARKAGNLGWNQFGALRVGNAYRDIAQPGGEHNQGAEARGRGM